MKSSRKGTSCRRDGLHAQHLLDSMSGVTVAITTNLMDALTFIVFPWLKGKCSHVLVDFLTSDPFTPFLKINNNIHPIVVGIIWWSLVSKIAMKGVTKDVV